MRKGTWKHVCAISEKDKSGRIRHKIYVDGCLLKDPMTVDLWFKSEKENRNEKTIFSFYNSIISYMCVICFI